MREVAVKIDEKTYAHMRALGENKTPARIIAECAIGGMIGCYTPQEVWDEIDAKNGDFFNDFMEAEIEKRLANA